MIQNINLLKKDLPYIENIKSFLVDIPRLHPDNPKYKSLWTYYTKHCIEGFWAFDNGGWRFMPPTLFFYGNFFKIEVEEEKIRKSVRPTIRDLDWHIHYAYLECQGFSGFKEDPKYSSDRALIDDSMYRKLEKSHIEIDRTRFLDIHQSTGKKKIYVSPRQLIRRLHEGAYGYPLYHNEALNLMVFGCLAKDIGIRMFDGSIKKIQDVKVGDLLLGPDSTERVVQDTIRGNSFMYKIKSKYSEEFKATDTHILRLRKRTYPQKKGMPKVLYEEVNMSVGDYLNHLQYRTRDEKYELYNSAIEYPKQETKWHPYILGLWLGDGFKACRKICMGEDDKETLQWLINYFEENNIRYRVKEEKWYPGKLGTKKVFRINWIEEDSLNRNNNWFAKTLLKNKHIPSNYLINDRQTRLEVLAGMIDSDGYYEEKATRFTITGIDYSLLTQFKELARSLGFRAIIHAPSRTGITDSLKYNLRITGNITEIPTRLPRKKAIKNSSAKHLNVFEVEFDDVEPFYGIEIDKDNLFCLEDYTVTHNSRGGGKSYSVTGISGQIMTFDGIKRFTKDVYLNPPTAKITIGAAGTGPSSDLISKVIHGLNCMATDKDLGVWGESEDEDFEPNPFFRSWTGDTKPGNKKNPYRYEYEVQTKNGWVKKGTRTSLFHLNYSDKKQDGSQTASGGRYNLNVYEEVGLMPNFKDALFNNIPTVSNDGYQYAVQIALGTSGNIDLVQQSKMVFNNPSEYNFVSFENVWEDDEHARNIGLFLPAYLSDKTFKDANGNTDIESALQHYMNRRLEAASKNDPAAIYNEKMNYPLIPSDMWITNKGSYFPQMELTERERDLLKDHLYRTIGDSVNLLWDSKAPNGVSTEINDAVEPFYDFPFTRSMSSITGVARIFHKPEFVKGEIPKDMYLFTLDPYVSDNIDEGGSIGAFYGYLNPKYWKTHKQTIVCSYIGKPIEGKEAFHEVCEKLIQYYGNCPRSFWYESNRSTIKEFFTKKNKTYLLALEPTRVKGSNIYQKKVQNYGFYVGNQTDKIEMIDDAAEMLLTECFDNKRFVETIPCIFLTRQLMQYELKGNFDAVSSFLGFPLAVKEMSHVYEQEAKKKFGHNPLAALSMNVNIFGSNELQRIKKKYATIKQEID